MKNWKVILCSENSELGEAEINRGVFQGDSLSPLVFVFVLELILAWRKGRL